MPDETQRAYLDEWRTEHWAWQVRVCDWLGLDKDQVVRDSLTIIDRDGAKVVGWDAETLDLPSRDCLSFQHRASFWTAEMFRVEIVVSPATVEEMLAEVGAEPVCPWPVRTYLP